MSDVSYSGPLNDWMAQAPPQPAPKVFGKSPAKLLEPYLSDPEQAQAAAEAAAARVRAPYAKANERVSGLPDVGTVIGNKLVNTLMAGPNLMGQVAEGSVDPNSPEAIRRSADVAASTLGYGMMGARPGAAGMAGGRLTQPAPVAEGAAKTGGLGDFIQAYHGSPHDFDRFDLSKIGTGEGAQAYGHGLYFAENEGVAKDYRNGLSDRIIEIGGKRVVPKTRDEILAANELAEVDHDFDKAIPGMKQFIADNQGEWKKNKIDAPYPGALKVLEDWKAQGATARPAGKMYQVAIKAPPEHFLDWDKPLSEQSPKVQEAIKKLPLSESDMKDILGDKGFSGMHLVQAMNWHPSVAEGSADRTTAALRDAGIPGIKYLDQGSRANTALELKQHPEGWFATDVAKGRQTGPFKTWQEAKASHQTNNYVVFNHDLIDILKKYGIAGVGALPAMNAYHFQKSDTGS